MWFSVLCCQLVLVLSQLVLVLSQLVLVLSQLILVLRQLVLVLRQLDLVLIQLSDVGPAPSSLAVLGDGGEGTDEAVLRLQLGLGLLPLQGELAHAGLVLGWGKGNEDWEERREQRGKRGRSREGSGKESRAGRRPVGVRGVWPGSDSWRRFSVITSLRKYYINN